MRIVNSMNHRIIIPMKIKYFGYTRYGKQLKSLKNMYQDQKCFFIGNGPSLKKEDLDLLYKNNIPTFAFNRIYNIFDETEWRPTFYISQDERILKNCLDLVDEIEIPYKFIPINFKWFSGITINNAYYFYTNMKQIDKINIFDFSDDISKKIEFANTGMYTAAQIAAYLGFKEIYLIGVDHQFNKVIGNDGIIVENKEIKNYFSDNYTRDNEKLNIPNIEKSTIAYQCMKKRCNDKGIKVFNATRGGKLEVFPRVAFDKLFEE